MKFVDNKILSISTEFQERLIVMNLLQYQEVSKIGKQMNSSLFQTADADYIEELDEFKSIIESHLKKDIDETFSI